LLVFFYFLLFIIVSINSYSVRDVNVEIIAISVKDMYNMGWLGAYVFS
jgi:hypothetical protein